MKHYSKLLIAVLLLVSAMAMVITTSFAWMTISKNPVAQGIQITISGSHTVLVAPDISVVQNGQEIHYPGTFTDTLNFSDFDQYAYLKESAGLLPVSTADGQTWYIPVYYQQGDQKVQSGEAHTGQLRPTTDFIPDQSLIYANLSEEDMDDNQQGSYVYLDFWVVAPVDGYKLRVSTGDDSAGSFAIDLLEPEAVTVDGVDTYTLTKAKQQAAASMRVGFLVNEDTVADDSMLLYTQSPHFNKSYKRLQGVYANAGMDAMYSEQTKFTIYEPNGNLHPELVWDRYGNPITDGQYVFTNPLGQGGVPTSVSDRLTVQMASRWTKAGMETAINQRFQTFIAGKDMSDETANTLKRGFYEQWLQYQIYPYVTKGNFLTKTADLYAIAGNQNVVQSEDLAGLYQSGATDDVYLTELTGGVPQRIRMFIWLEGQDVDCINSAATGSFALRIVIAGSNAS